MALGKGRAAMASHNRRLRSGSRPRAASRSRRHSSGPADHPAGPAPPLPGKEWYPVLLPDASRATAQAFPALSSPARPSRASESTGKGPLPNGLRIALLGYNDFRPREFEAGPSWPGVAWAVDDQVLADLKAARSVHKADLVIPYLHWGWEGCPANQRQKRLARLMIENGADVVVGHPHVTQGAEYYRGK